jgi:flagellar biosynthesis component FlhA
MSDFLNISVLVLATMVLVLAGMVGYLYWQQNKLLRSMSTLSTFVSSQFLQHQVHEKEEEEPKKKEETVEETVEESEDESEDDRLSVEIVEIVETETEQKVEIPQDIDDYQTKTMPQLRELLNKKGIPYGKRDSKTILLELLKASS